MKVIHINSGLGNQMLGYCALLSLRQSNPGDSFYLDTTIYELPDECQWTSNWNGYELNKVFGIDTPSIKTVFTDEQWKGVIRDIMDSRFWEKAMNYPVYFTQAFNNAGLHLVNKKGNYEDPNGQKYRSLHPSPMDRTRDWFFNRTGFGVWFKRIWREHHESDFIRPFAHPERLFMKTDEDIFTGLLLDFKYRGNHIELIDKEIRETFVFPDYSTDRNREFSAFLDSCNSVFIHARRGDMLSANGWCYKYGYFKRAVRYIKKNVADPVFVFFTNTGSIEWCKENAKLFGLDLKRDNVLFVDWNTGEDSFRDMQLMSHCKHGIITNSTFGWWGAYLIDNPDKITISPLVEINTTYHC